ncbi:hypothetical protein BKA62DRAFT_723641 [Auriculariales sp. MPI-PUGE-AT-0066]|nr:hypothetical protein BKA62DRAFT_723641 [Auriculariales sp. MPI-PUGE-AT-0066]
MQCYSRVCYAVLCLLLSAQLSLAAFSRAACRNNDCIQQNHLGHWCYHPSPDTELLDLCPDDQLLEIARAHAEPPSVLSRLSLASYPRSVAYYNARTGGYLGNGDWAVENSSAPIEVTICLTGVRAGSGEVITTCYRASGDDDFSSSVHTGLCTIKHSNADRVVRDRCCGPPRSSCPTNGGFFRLNIPSRHIISL